MSSLEERQAGMRERMARNETPVLRAHSVDKAAVRRVSKSVLRPSQPDRSRLVHAVSIGHRSPFALKPVPVSQVIDVRPEITSGENNPVAVKESLAPEMFMGRAVTRCRHCHLNQFVTANGNCRKCRQSLAPEPVPDVHPVATVNNGYGRPSRAPVPGVGYDVAFAVKLLRTANGLSQRDLAKLLGCPRTWISKIENRAASPQVDSIIELAAALEATPYALITIAEAACAA